MTKLKQCRHNFSKRSHFSILRASLSRGFLPQGDMAYSLPGIYSVLWWSHSPFTFQKLHNNFFSTRRLVFCLLVLTIIPHVFDWSHVWNVSRQDVSPYVFLDIQQTLSICDIVLYLAWTQRCKAQLCWSLTFPLEVFQGISGKWQRCLG